MEHALKLLKLKLEHGTLDENTFYCIEDTFLCTLHMEDRLGLISISLFFLEGNRNGDNWTLFDTPGIVLTGH